MDAFGQLVPQHGCKGELMAVFQFLNQNIQWKFVTQRCNRSIKSRRFVQAVAAGQAVDGGQGAARTVRVLVPGQAGVAGRAEHFIVACGTAQQATMRQNKLHNICAAVQNGCSII